MSIPFLSADGNGRRHVQFSDEGGLFYFFGAARYLLGHEPPRYPVPAVVYEACILDDYTAVLERMENTAHGYWVRVHVYPPDVGVDDFEYP